jgi:hypothetical protein
MLAVHMYLAVGKQGCQLVYFQTKIPIRVHYGGYCNERFWPILWPLVYFVVIWFIFTRFGMLCKKNLATLLASIVYS